MINTELGYFVFELTQFVSPNVLKFLISGALDDTGLTQSDLAR
jgi:hypothetical protein